MARQPTSSFVPTGPAVHRSNHEDRHLPNGPDELNWSGAIHMSGTVANRPAASAMNKGCFYFATDTGLLYRSDGATWTQIGGTSGVPSGAAGGALDGTYPNPGLAAAVAGAGLTETTDVLSVNATAPLGITSDAVAFNTGYRATFAGTSAPTTPTPTKGDHWFDTTNNLDKVYNGSVWITVTPVGASVATSQTLTGAGSLSYKDLATSGPAVTVSTGTAAMVTITATMSENNPDFDCWSSFAVSGATTTAASDTWSILHNNEADEPLTGSVTYPMTGLTAGSNTFTMKYKIADISTVGTFANRFIVVQAIPT